MARINPKVANAALAGAASVCLVWLAHQFTHVEIPGEVASAITTILSVVAGWFTSDDNLTA